jgi:hypothetical protein
MNAAWAGAETVANNAKALAKVQDLMVPQLI